MHRLFLLLISALSLLSCEKEAVNTAPVEPAVEPIPTRIISSDTLTTGQFWALSIGETGERTYTTLQNTRVANRINYLGIVANVYSNVSDVENTLALYTSLYFDETVGTPEGIQLNFLNDKIQSIWTNNGKKLLRWPDDMPENSVIRVNDPVSDLYTKLVGIKAQQRYAKKFERISLFSKDLTKEYDSRMSSSPQWHFSATVDDRRFYVIHLNFNLGKLQSIYRTLMERAN